MAPYKSSKNPRKRIMFTELRLLEERYVDGPSFKFFLLVAEVHSPNTLP